MRALLLVIFLAAPFAAVSQFKAKRAFTALAGLAVKDGNSGYHFEIGSSYQPKGFGIGVYSGLVNVPDDRFFNWTMIGLQLKGVSPARVLRPYGTFDAGLINLQTINDDVNLRTCSINLGGGIEKSIRNKISLFVDVRWRWLVDYRGEWAAPRMVTVSLGLKIQ